MRFGVPELFIVPLLLVITAAVTAQPAPLIGKWHGTSKCVDRVAAPACNYEKVIYEFTPGDKPGVVHWKADKVVAGKSDYMGEFDLTYSAADASWTAQFGSPRLTVEWRLVVAGDRITGTGRHLPGKEVIRQIDVRRMR